MTWFLFVEDGWQPVALFAVCAALGGWWCAGFSWRCGQLLRVPAQDTATDADPMDPHAAVAAALYPSPSSGGCSSCGPPWPQTLFMACVAGISALALSGRYGGVGVVGIACVVAVLMLLALAFIDARSGLLPDALTLPLLWLGLALAWMGGAISLHEAVAGAMVGYGFLYVLFLGFRVWRGRDGMGHGDFKLAAALGAWVGPLSLAYVLLAACLLGTVYALWRRKAREQSAGYPFGPFLAAAGILVLTRFPELHLGF